MLDARAESYVATIVEAAERDASIARVLREICALESSVRIGALGVIAAHLRIRLTAPAGGAGGPAGRAAAPAGRAAAPADVFECLEALGRDDVAHRIAERLGPPG